MKIISRNEWGAREPKYPFKKHVPNKITIHHIGSSDSKPIIPNFDGSSSIKSVERHHMDTNGWNNIGYHYLIAPNGDIYEGRPDNVSGAHVKHKNTGNIGINVWCNSNVEHITREQFNSLSDIIKMLMDKYSIVIDEVYGHKDLGNTSCPGTHLYTSLQSIKHVITNPLHVEPKETDKTKILKMMKDISEIMNSINVKMIEIIKLLK